MTLPSFLIVGAMKGGSTTLYQDIRGHPRLCMPEFKEPEILLHDCTDGEAKEQYARHFRLARVGQLCGEASTAYTKRPQHEGVAARARALLGKTTKIIYIRRDPIARAVSHYRHDRQHGLIEESFEDALEKYPHLIDFGRYDWQIAPWIAEFGKDQVLTLDLEKYQATRRASAERVIAFLGINPKELPPFDEVAIANAASEQKHIASTWLRSLVYSNAYQRLVKPVVPQKLRTFMRRSVLPPPSDEAVEVTPRAAQVIMQTIERDQRK